VCCNRQKLLSWRLKNFEICIKDENIEVDLKIKAETESWRSDTVHQFFDDEKMFLVPGWSPLLKGMLMLKSFTKVMIHQVKALVIMAIIRER